MMQRTGFASLGRYMVHILNVSEVVLSREMLSVHRAERGCYTPIARYHRLRN